jgi:ribonuclease Z
MKRDLLVVTPLTLKRCCSPSHSFLFRVDDTPQLQIQRTACIRPSRITKIFITHAHGDHTFGLPGLLCLMGQRDTRGDGGDGGGGAPPPIEIYGPEGLRTWLRVAVRYSVSRIVPPHRVHELMDVPMAPEWEYNPRSRRYQYGGHGRNRQQQKQKRQQQHAKGEDHNRWVGKGLAGEDPVSWISQASQVKLEPSTLYGEVDGGRDIYPVMNHPLSTDGAPVWEVVDDEEDVRVYAAPMSHGIPCVGYVVEELPRPGRLRSELVEPVVRRNVDALRQAGYAIPMKAMAVIKNLQPGQAFTFPDGTVVTQEEAVEPAKRGRKVAICGDTADARALRHLAMNADVIVHEATNAHLPGVDDGDATLRDVTRDAVVHGHSTPQIAAEFCRSARGRRLVLNHFSARYKGDTSVDSLSIMMRIEEQAMKAAELDESRVAAAWDLMVLPIRSH